MQMIARSHEGLVRVNNEDCVRVFEAGNGHPGFAVVADGMGGLMGGEDASHSAVEAVRAAICDAGMPVITPEQLVPVMEFAHSRVAEFAQELNYYGRMGTTLMLWVATPSGGIFAHVGDSRLYGFDGSVVQQLSHDHTVAQRLEDTGIIGPGKAKYHRQKHVLTQAIGLPGLVQPEVGEVAPFQRLLLCTDGLSDLVSEEKMASALQHDELDFTASELLRYALDEGGRDNISVALID